jgi:phospholipase/carboxylesterase
LSLRAPLTFAPGSFGWFEVRFRPEGSVIRLDEAVASWQRLMAFVAQAPAVLAADPAGVYLFGFSQGAIMSVVLALTRPDLLAGIVALSGRTLPELFDRATPFGPFLASPESLKDFPFFIGHGLRDQVLPVHHARATRDRLATLPVSLTYREYEMGHFISEQCLSEVAGWLSERLDELEERKEP